MTRLDAQSIIVRLKSSGMSYRKIAARIGSSQPRISNWVAGNNQPTADKLDLLRDLYEEAFPDDLPSNVTRHVDGRHDGAGGNIPNLTIHGGMGPGSVEVVSKTIGGQIDPEYLSGYWSLPPDVRSAVPNIAVIHALPVRGDSMYPTLSSGDIVFIDTSHKFPSPADIYAIDYGDGLVVKRVELVPRKKTIYIISDNKQYEPHELNRADVRVYGRVVGRFQWRG